MRVDAGRCGEVRGEMMGEMRGVEGVPTFSRCATERASRSTPAIRSSLSRNFSRSSSNSSTILTICFSAVCRAWPWALACHVSAREVW